MVEKRVYGKPLVKGTVLEDNPDRRELLKEAGDVAVKAIQTEIRKLSFKGSPNRLIHSFTFRIEGKSTLVIESDHPAAKYLNKGVRSYQMRHLVKAKRPIPIITETGEVIFRNATLKSMKEGKWVHPGLRGMNFLDMGLRKAKEQIKAKVAEDIKQRMKSRFRSV